MTKLAIVTGANKGIGFEITKKLLLSSQLTHLSLTSRNTKLGEEACERLKTSHPESLKQTELLFHQLDLDDMNSIKTFANHLSEKFVKEDGGVIDVLINNAGFAFKVKATESFIQQANVTLGINYFGTLHVCEHLLPLMKPGGRIVNVSSQAGLLSNIKSKNLKDKFLDPQLSIDQLSGLMNKFIDDVANSRHEQEGWPNTTYGVSKIGENALTRVLAREHPQLKISSCCPGWCRTDMAGPNATKSAEEGAITPAWLAQSVIDDFKSGGFWFENKLINP